MKGVFLVDMILDHGEGNECHDRGFVLFFCKSEARTRLGRHKGAKRFVLDNGVMNVFVLRVCCALKAKRGNC